MKNRKFVGTIIILTAFIGAIVSCTPTDQNQKPNIIIILADDLGYGELGCYGQEIIETPNIDKLAEKGIMFTQFYCGSPVCAPSRCALLTGKHPGHMYIRGNDEWSERGEVWSYEAMNADPYLEGQRPLPDSTVTIGTVLKKNGYKTAMIGKWGLGGPATHSTPNDMGFDFFYGYNCQRQAHTYYPVHLWKNREKDSLRNKPVAPHTILPEHADPFDAGSYSDFQLDDYSPKLMLTEALGFIENNKSDPFFLCFTTPIPHVALQAPQKWINHYHEKLGEEEPYLGESGYFPCQYPRATYAAMISYLDGQVGEMVKKLEELNLTDNTIIIFTSDNGPTYAGGADTEYFKSAAPFSAKQGRAKGSLYEGGIRVPLIVSYPSMIKTRSLSHHIGAFWDIMPTLADWTGCRTELNTDGISMLSELTGHPKEQVNHDYLYWEHNGKQAVIMGKWKAIRIDASKPHSPVELFDLISDPTERIDVSGNFPEIVAQILLLMNHSHEPCKDNWQKKWNLVNAATP